jgi:gliding motility-associated-like protein
LPKAPVDTIWANTDYASTCNLPVVIHVLSNDGLAPDPGTVQTGTAIRIIAAGDANHPLHGRVTFNDTTITYVQIPGDTFRGVDSFVYVISDNGIPQQHDTAMVYVYVCSSPIVIAVDDNANCTDTTTFVNVPVTINILANDTISPAQDTTVAILTQPLHGTLVLNPDRTVTYTPDSGFHGNDHFDYQLCARVDSLMGCDTASVCINVVDTAIPCFFPNGFSPNGDGVNDVFAFPCYSKFPDATLQVFNRWGDGVWESKGGYKNDWAGTNLQGVAVPDGTYYFVYKYNDGSGKSEARFVVVYRGATK